MADSFQSLTDHSQAKAARYAARGADADAEGQHQLHTDVDMVDDTVPASAAVTTPVRAGAPTATGGRSGVKKSKSSSAARVMEHGSLSDLLPLLQTLLPRLSLEKQDWMIQAFSKSAAHPFLYAFLSSCLSAHCFPVGRVGSTTDFITQKVEYAGGRESEKMDRLLHILSTCEGLTLIFVETKRNADFLEHQLCNQGIEATSIHGDRTQDERERALLYFRTGRCPVLVATDVASRGLDIPDVRAVINYDLPNNIDDYVHRIGRTGRAGNKGTAIAFIDERKPGILRDLFDLMKEELPQY